jgi:hypothetical protein
LRHYEIEPIKDNAFGRRTGIGIAVVPDLPLAGARSVENKPTGASWIGDHLHKLMAQKDNFAIRGDRMIADRGVHPSRTPG